MSAGHEPVRLGDRRHRVHLGRAPAVRACAAPRVDLVAVASARGRATRERVGAARPGRAPPDHRRAAREPTTSRRSLVCTRTRRSRRPRRRGARGRQAPAAREARGDRPGRPPPDRGRRGRASPARSCASPITAATTRASARSPRPSRSGAIGAPFAVQLASREDFPPSADDGPAGGFIMDVGRARLRHRPLAAAAGSRHRLHPRPEPRLPRRRPRQRPHHGRPRRRRRDDPPLAHVDPRDGDPLRGDRPRRLGRARPGRHGRRASPCARRRPTRASPPTAATASPPPTRPRWTTSARPAAASRRRTRRSRTTAGRWRRRSPRGPAPCATSRSQVGPDWDWEHALPAWPELRRGGCNRHVRLVGCSGTFHPSAEVTR